MIHYSKKPILLFRQKINTFTSLWVTVKCCTYNFTIKLEIDKCIRKSTYETRKLELRTQSILDCQ